jgi:hypothetical protein
MNNQQNKDIFKDISDETMIKASELLEEKHRLEKEYKKVMKSLEAEIKKEEGEIVELQSTITKECPVCYCELDVNNIVNLQCKHSLCIDCFANWVDKGEKNSCPCCRSAILNSSKHKSILEWNIIDLEKEQADIQEDIIECKKRCRNICNLQDKLMNMNNKCKSSINTLRITQKRLVREIGLSEMEFENICQSIDIAIDKKKAWDKNPKLGIEYWTRKHNKFKRANEKRLQSFKRNLSCELNGMKKEHNKYYVYRKSNGELVDFNLKPSHIVNQKLRQKLYNNFNAVKNSLDVDLNGCMNMFEEDTTNYETATSYLDRLKGVDKNDENLYLEGLFWEYEEDYEGYESSDSDYDSDDSFPMPELVDADTEDAFEFLNEIRSPISWATTAPGYYITPRSLTREFNRIGQTNRFFLQE